MGLANKTELEASVLDWMERPDQTVLVTDFLTLAEARLNRELGLVTTDIALSGTVSSREVDISSVSYTELLQLFLTDEAGDDDEITRKNYANMDFVDDEGQPAEWALKGDDTIVFERPCDEAYSLRLVFNQRFALTDASSTNWLLDEHPDVYLAACLMWGAGYREDWPNGSVWKAIIDEQIPAVRNFITQSKRGLLAVDNALLQRNTYYNGEFV